MGWGGVGWVGGVGSESKFSVSSGPNLLEFESGLNLEPSLTIMIFVSEQQSIAVVRCQQLS